MRIAVLAEGRVSGRNGWQGKGQDRAGLVEGQGERGDRGDGGQEESALRVDERRQGEWKGRAQNKAAGKAEGNIYGRSALRKDRAKRVQGRTIIECMARAGRGG